MKPGQDVGIIVKPDKGYQLSDLRVVSQKDATESAPVSEENVFHMIDDDVIVKADFVEATDYYKVKADTTLKGGHVLLDQSEPPSAMVWPRPSTDSKTAKPSPRWSSCLPMV